MVSTSTQIAGFDFDNCLMNAAGVACMTIEELAEVKDSVAGTFVTKTATLEFRQGNPEPRYQDVPLGSINSMGLPNNGLDYYLDYLLELQESLYYFAKYITRLRDRLQKRMRRLPKKALRTKRAFASHSNFIKTQIFSRKRRFYRS